MMTFRKSNKGKRPWNAVPLETWIDNSISLLRVSRPGMSVQRHVGRRAFKMLLVDSGDVRLSGGQQGLAFVRRGASSDAFKRAVTAYVQNMGD